MRDVNTMTKPGYLLINLVWACLWLFIYHSFCFVNLFDLNSDASRRVLILTMILGDAVGVAATFRHRRNLVNTSINVIFPLALYTIAAYFRYIGVFIVIVLTVACVVSLGYVVMTRMYSQSDVCGENRSFSSGRYSILGVRAITTACCSVVVLYLIGSSMTGSYQFRSVPSSKSGESGFGEYFTDNAETFMLLEQRRWEQLSSGEKFNVMQAVCDAERIRLGISHPIVIQSRNLKDDLLGCYVHSKRQVLIDSKHLEEDSSSEILETVTHECFHSYEHNLVELYNSVGEKQKELRLFDKAEIYRAEFADYQDDGSLRYYSQQVEEDSRTCAAQETERYYSMILTYPEEGARSR